MRRQQSAMVVGTRHAAPEFTMGMDRRTAGFLIAGMCVITMAGAQAKTAPRPVYIHMNMKSPSMILESTIAVRPGQKVVFINQDNDIHTIVGYDPKTGATIQRINGSIPASAGMGKAPGRYIIEFKHIGRHYYYCSVHAYLKPGPGKTYSPAIRPGVKGFGAPMAGVIIVTTNKRILAENPKTSSEKFLPM